MRIWGIAVTFFLLSLSGAASAGSYQGKITSVFASSNKVFIFLNHGNFDNSNTCTGTTNSLVLWLDPATEYGKAMLSIALTAKTADILVWASGNNSCIDGPSNRKAEAMVAIDLKG